MSRDTSITLSRNTKAGGLVAASVFLISFLPVFVAFSGTESPFLFGCVWRIGLALARIHRRRALGTALEEARGCPHESGIMVLKQQTDPRTRSTQ